MLGFSSKIIIMKLRIRGNSLRLRLTKTEVAKIAEQGLVEEKTDFGNGQVFVYAVATSIDFETVTAEFKNGQVKVFIPLTIAEIWSTSEEVGISVQQNSLKIQIEKDFNCLTPRNAEEDADTFPHPKEI
jgi:hypothetical protein